MRSLMSRMFSTIPSIASSPSRLHAERLDVAPAPVRLRAGARALHAELDERRLPGGLGGQRRDQRAQPRHVLGVHDREQLRPSAPRASSPSASVTESLT